jgi:hypothetical protein
MYGLSVAFDPDMFVGRAIESVSFSINTISIAFADGLRLTSFTWVAYHPAHGETMCRDDVPVTSSSLMRLAECRVSSAARTARGGLDLSFETGGFLSVDDDEPAYECFSIVTPDGELFV